MAGNPSIHIPEPHREPLARLRDLPPDASERFRAPFEESPSSHPATRQSLVDRIAASVPELPPEHIDTLLDAFVALRFTMESHQWTAEKIASAVSNAPFLRTSDETAPEHLIHLLADIIKSPQLVPLARRVEVMRSHERSLHGARIITDIRPVFGDEPTEPPPGAAIMHTLRIDCLQNGRMESIYLAIDNDDIALLERLLDRAKKKASTLDKVVQQGGMDLHELREF